MEAEDVLVLSRKYTERLIQGAGDPAIVQNVTKIANISPNGNVVDIDRINITSGSSFVAPVTGWLNAVVTHTGKAYLSLYIEGGYGDNNDRYSDNGFVSITMPVTKGDVITINYTGTIGVLKVFEVEPIEPKYITSEKLLAVVDGSTFTQGLTIQMNDLSSYSHLKLVIYGGLDTYGDRIYDLSKAERIVYERILSPNKLNVFYFILEKKDSGLTVSSVYIPNDISLTGTEFRFYGINDINVKDLVNPIVTDEKKLLYSGRITNNGNIMVGDMSKYDKIEISGFLTNNSNLIRIFDRLPLTKETNHAAMISFQVNDVYTLMETYYVNDTTITINGYKANQLSKWETHIEIYGYNEVLVNDLVNDLVIGDTVELYKGTPIKGNNKLNGKIEDYDYYMVELIYNNRQREQLFIKVGAPFNLLSPAGGTGYWEVIGTISGYDLNLSTLVIPSSASGVTIIRVTGIKTVTANSLIDKLVIRDSKELAEIPLSKSGDIKSQKVEGLENYDYFEVFFIDSNKKYSSAVNIVRYGESFMASNQYTANLHRSVLGNISNGAINIVEVNGNLYPSYVKVIGYKTVSADDISDIVVSDKAKLVAIKASEVVNGTKRTLPNDISYYDEIIAQLVIPTPNGKYVVETVPYFPEGLSEGLLVISKSYTYGNQDYRRVDIRFTGAEIELFNINIAPDRDDCDLILYGVKNTSVDDITTKLVIDKSVDTLLERTEISGVMEYELQKTVEPYGMIIAALYGEWASSGLAKVSEISLDAGVPSALIYNYDSDNRAFVNVKVEGSKATVSSFLKGSGIDRLYLKITNHKF